VSAAGPIVAVYADESCLGNGQDGDNPGGAGGLIELRHPRSGALVRLDFWISDPATTNNRMAIRSALQALTIFSAKGERASVVFTSDSQYLVKGMREWVPGWIRRGWRRKGGALENVALWQELAAASRGHDIDWRWVRGHKGHPQNEYANFLAVRAAQRLDASGGAVPSEFDAWLAAARAKGQMTLAPDPLPEAAGFRPAPPLPAEGAASLFS
jgi:ribonuclease HI